MTIDMLRQRGTPLEQQRFTWNELVQPPYSKLDDDAFTRVRVLLMSAMESEALRFGHACARMNQDLAHELARIRRIEQHQMTLINWLNPPDQSVLETTIAYEQAAIEVTAALAHDEPDPYLAQVYRFGLLEDLDHMYRFAALLDRVEGKDANNLLQSYTDVLPGRPTALQHRHPDDDVRARYDRQTADLITKLHAYTQVALAAQKHAYYMNVGPLYPDPVGRQLYAEIASIEEQHVTQYESIIDADESWLEKWLLHEASEVYHYDACARTEENARIRAIWERFLDYELGQLRHVAALFERFERRDAAEVLSMKLHAPTAFVSHRSFVRSVLRDEVGLTARGPHFLPREAEAEDSASRLYRAQQNASGNASDRVSAGYVWAPGTELAREAPHALHGGKLTTEA